MEEVITILNGLTLERKYDIQMTMKNLKLLLDKVAEEQKSILEKQFNEMIKKEKG